MITLRAFSTPPYRYELINPLNQTIIETIISSKNQVDMVNDPAYFTWKITDGNGKVRTATVDVISKSIIKKPWFGRTIPNGSKDDHLAAIREAKAEGYNSVGVLFNVGDTNLGTDAQFNDPRWDQELAVQGTPSLHYDEVVLLASELGITLRVNIDFLRPTKWLNGTPGRTQFFGHSDLMMHKDGTPMIENTPDFIIQFDTVGSIASPAYVTYCKKIAAKYAKRYKQFLNNGTIIYFTGKLTWTAESHYEMHKRVNGGSGAGDAGEESIGDCNPMMIAKFQLYCKNTFGNGVPTNTASFNAATNVNITNFDQLTLPYLLSNISLSTKIGRFFYWYKGRVLKEFYDGIWKFIKDNVAGLTRTKFACLDLGSLSDPLGPSRGSLNFFDLLDNPLYICAKSNDLTTYPVNWTIPLVKSLADSFGGFGMIEPTPGGPMSQEMNNYIAYINKAKNNGVSVSIFPTLAEVQPAIDATNLRSYSSYVRQQVMALDGQSLSRFTFKASEIIADRGAFFVGANPSIHTKYQMYPAFSSHVLIKEIDDINPNIAVAPAPDAPITPPPVVASGSVGGTFVETVNGKTYTITRSARSPVTVLPTGNLKVTLPSATLPSTNGQKTCKPFIIINAKVPSQEVRDGLLSPQGYPFPTGTTYAIDVCWYDQDTMQTYDDLNISLKVNEVALFSGNKFQNGAGTDPNNVTIV